jgi:hypothetical protein
MTKRLETTTATSTTMLRRRPFSSGRQCLSGDSEFFVGLAQIAGVFVGFGAVIGFTRRGDVAAADRGLLQDAHRKAMSCACVSLNGL